MNELDEMAPALLANLARATSLFMTILNQRLLTLIGMLLCAGLFAWTLWMPDTTRLAGACAFAVLVYLPLQRAESRRASPRAQPEPQPRVESE